MYSYPPPIYSHSPWHRCSDGRNTLPFLFLLVFLFLLSFFVPFVFFLSCFFFPVLFSPRSRSGVHVEGCSRYRRRAGDDCLPGSRGISRIWRKHYQGGCLLSTYKLRALKHSEKYVLQFVAVLITQKLPSETGVHR